MSEYWHKKRVKLTWQFLHQMYTNKCDSKLFEKQQIKERPHIFQIGISFFLGHKLMHMVELMLMFGVITDKSTICYRFCEIIAAPI